MSFGSTYSIDPLFPQQDAFGGGMGGMNMAGAGGAYVDPFNPHHQGSMSSLQTLYFLNIFFSAVIFTLAAGQIYTRDFIDNHCQCSASDEHVNIWFGFSILAIILGVILLGFSLVALITGRSIGHQFTRIGQRVAASNQQRAAAAAGGGAHPGHAGQAAPMTNMAAGGAPIQAYSNMPGGTF